MRAMKDSMAALVCAEKVRSNNDLSALLFLGEERPYFLPQAMLWNPENPSLNLRLRAFIGRQLGMKKLRKASVVIGIPHPGSDGTGVVLIGRATVAWKSSAPQGWIHLGYDRNTVSYLPPIEWPEMDSRRCMVADESEPGETGMRGLRH